MEKLKRIKNYHFGMGITILFEEVVLKCLLSE